MTPAAFALGLEARGPSDRMDHRALMADQHDQQVCEVSHDSVATVWVLDVVGQDG